MFGWDRERGVREGELVMHERPDGNWVRYEDLVTEVGLRLLRRA